MGHSTHLVPPVVICMAVCNVPLHVGLSWGLVVPGEFTPWLVVQPKFATHHCALCGQCLHTCATPPPQVCIGTNLDNEQTRGGTVHLCTQLVGSKTTWRWGRKWPNSALKVTCYAYLLYTLVHLSTLSEYLFFGS